MAVIGAGAGVVCVLGTCVCRYTHAETRGRCQMSSFIALLSVIVFVCFWSQGPSLNKACAQPRSVFGE